MGNMLGILGVGSGVLASLLAVGFSPEVLTQFGALATIGAMAGKSPRLVDLTCILTDCRNADWQADYPY